MNSVSTAVPESRSADPSHKPLSGRLFFLNLSGRVLSATPDGSDLKTIVDGGRRHSCGIVVDVEAGHLYWTNLGNPGSTDGSVERSDLDGKNLTSIVPPGATFTPRQLRLDKKAGKLYWSDREGTRVMRANLDGSAIETLVETGCGADDRRDARKWFVGIALDVTRGKLYWTQREPDHAGQGRICRASLELPEGQTPADRKDIEVLFEGLPEPIDLDLELVHRVMYWTDRRDPSRGNAVNRAPMDPKPGDRRRPEVVFDHLMEGIGIALDLKGGRMFLTDLAGSVYSADLDGSRKTTLLVGQGNLTGIAYVEVPQVFERRPRTGAITTAGPFKQEFGPPPHVAKPS